MIQLQNVKYSVGQRVLFEDLNWVLAPGDRVALVGPNGAGKTTLLRIILGDLAPETGSRVMARGTRLGYLPQEAAERFDGTVLDRAMEAHRALRGMQEELDELHARLGGIGQDDPALESLLERAGELQHHLEFNDTATLEPEARRVLSGLGFSRKDQDRPLAEFSGGWRMRTALAALLLTDPTLLFLDEPTNHLDLPAMEWLEDYLEDFHGGLVIVSHDRVFLDSVATEIRELDRGELTDYPMRFTEYLEERVLRRERVAAQNQQLDKRISELSRFVERFGAKNTKAAAAQSKRKMIDRLRKGRVVLPRPPRGIRFQFPNPPHAGRTLIRLRDGTFGYGAEDVFADARLEIDRGDKIAIVGANGAGKTTLLRVLAGQLELRRGELECPAQTKLAYFAQHAAETLDAGHTVLDALEATSPPEWRPRLRGLLGSFLFSGDDVFKLCRILSGGERQRVALARILLAPANLLLLDEPTHHLDLAGKEVLEDALEQYPGAVIVVTHDRALMARIATRVIEVDHGRVVYYPGGYNDYEAARVARANAGTQLEPRDEQPARGDSSSGGKGGGKSGPKGGSKGGGKSTAAAQQQSRAADNEGAHGVAQATAPREDRTARAERQKREREAARIEKDIEGREARVQVLETQLADPTVYQDVARSKDIVGEYERVKAELESLWQRLGDLN